jgi:PTH1 family peptidyl-tRNA hydrolase
MGLFTTRPAAGPAVQYYTLGNNRTILVVGLGNIGATYDGTRHNLGFLCVDAFAAKAGWGDWQDKKDLKCQLVSGLLGSVRIIAIKPTTFMNLSGEAVQAVCHFYKIPPKDVLVIHDELDIPFGQIRLRTGGSPAGHNGIKSVSQHLGADYGRIRIGIGPKQPPQIDSADFVLQRFSTQEQTHLGALTNEVTAILYETVYGGQLPTDTRSFIE